MKALFAFYSDLGTAQFVRPCSKRLFAWKRNKANQKQSVGIALIEVAKDIGCFDEESGGFVGRQDYNVGISDPEVFSRFVLNSYPVRKRVDVHLTAIDKAEVEPIQFSIDIGKGNLELVFPIPVNQEVNQKRYSTNSSKELKNCFPVYARNVSKHSPILSLIERAWEEHQEGEGK